MNSKLTAPSCCGFFSGRPINLDVCRRARREKLSTSIIDFPVLQATVSLQHRRLDVSIRMLKLLLISIHQFHSCRGGEEGKLHDMTDMRAKRPRNFNWCMPLEQFFFLLILIFWLLHRSHIIWGESIKTTLSHFPHRLLIDFRRDWPFGKTQICCGNKWLCDDWQLYH